MKRQTCSPLGKSEKRQNFLSKVPSTWSMFPMFASRSRKSKASDSYQTLEDHWGFIVVTVEEEGEEVEPGLRRVGGFNKHPVSSSSASVTQNWLHCWESRILSKGFPHSSVGEGNDNPLYNTLAWEIPRTEETSRLQSMGSLRVGHDWATSLSCTGEGNGNPLQYSCLENFRDGIGHPRVGWPLWGRRVGHNWSDLAAAAA